MEHTVSRKELRRIYNRWWWTVELCNSYERMQSVSFCYAMIPLLKRLYPNEEDYKESLQRHLQLFNTEGDWGGTVIGVVAAMEESRALTGAPDGEVISSVKTGLMGPLAGIGDSVNSTMVNIFYPIAIAMSQNGSPLGAIFIWVFAITQWLLGWNLCKFGYDIGSEGISKILSGGLVNRVLTAAGSLGLLMMGSLCANNVKFSLAISWVTGEATKTLQEYIDGIIPGLFPLLITWALYFYMKKHGTSLGKVVLIILAVCLVLSFFGIV